ncbi:acetate/propionate family kinase [Candidatus Albibeggiatoa sp. nov. NOAA]|uniref:acetate/propionate family kinase n=1 Tax=Candidatus Albibeggiatoa sp. nov. NOAA TaxID=3162724 RepID=UPI003304B79A|nr:acetate/propionate family kinase [Thiotrichaceae bacterium]
MMQQVILVINAGSSSIKFAIYTLSSANTLQAIYHGMAEGIGVKPHFFVKNQTNEAIVDCAVSDERGQSHIGMLSVLLDWLDTHNEEQTLLAVGHRVVHGGDTFRSPVVIDDDVIAKITELTPLAPLHQPHHLAAIHALQQLRPELPQVACFDTAFHRSQEPIAQMFAISRELMQQGVKRYGFHGLSYEYIASVLPDYVGMENTGKTIVCHLGNGASLCAIEHGQSVASTTGFSAVEGLPMGTRCGSIDVGVALHLWEQGYSLKQATDVFYKQSGLLGMSGGISADMRILLDNDDPNAQEAVEHYCYRVAREIGSLAVAMQGLNHIVFTAGIGEHAAPVREKVCERLAWLGVGLDTQANQQGQSLISTDDSQIAVWVIPTNEEIIIAQHSLKLVSTS